MKKKFIIITIFYAISLLVLISFSSKIFNPFLSIHAIIKLTFSDTSVEKISDKPLRYISRDYNDFIYYMESQGYTVEQMGRGFDLKKGSNRIVVESEGFLNYEIFTQFVKH